MNIAFDAVSYAAESSLTLIVDDISRRRVAGGPLSVPLEQDLESWLNAFQRQSLPLIHSKQGLANLEAWLAAVETDSADA